MTHKHNESIQPRSNVGWDGHEWMNWFFIFTCTQHALETVSEIFHHASKLICSCLPIIVFTRQNILYRMTLKLISWVLI